MFYQIFFSPQVKWCAIITYKHGIYELPNGLRLRILGNKEKSGNWLKFIEWQSSTQSSHQKESFVNTRRKIFWKIRCATPHENQSQPQILPDTLRATVPGNIPTPPWPQVTPDISKLNFLDIFCNSTDFHTVLT